MQLGDSVDCMAANTGQVSHSNVPLAAFVDQRHSTDPRRVIEVLEADLIQEAAVNFVNDLQMPRQQAAEGLIDHFSSASGKSV